MVAENTCRSCGTMLDDTVRDGDCPTCLIQLGIDAGRSREPQDLAAPTIDEMSARLPDFDVTEIVGRGGMGVVYRARQKRLDRDVAIKVLLEDAAAHVISAERFVREAKALAKLHHQHIVTAFDAGEVDGLSYLVMQLVDGCDLRTLIAESGPVGGAEAVDWVLQAARGLEYAHRKGIVHRDIKPGNLLLDEDGVVRVLDLGLARFDDDRRDHREVSHRPSSEHTADRHLTGSGHVLGTVDFMAPEQAVDTHAADARSDVYSLGCTLYYLLTGQAIFDGDSVVKRIIAHREQEPPELPESLTTDMPGLSDVYHRMVAKDADSRPQSMTEVIAELEAVLRGDSLPGPEAASTKAENSVGFATSAVRQTGLMDETLVLAKTAETDSGTPLRGVSPARQANVAKSRTTLKLLIAGVVALLAFVVYRIQTDNGTLVVRIDPAYSKEIDLLLRDQGLEVVDHHSDQKWSVRPGKSQKLGSSDWKVAARDGLKLSVRNESGLELDPERFVIRRNDRVILDVSLEAAVASTQTVPPSPVRAAITPPTKSSDLPVELFTVIDSEETTLTVHDPDWEIQHVLQVPRGAQCSLIASHDNRLYVGCESIKSPQGKRLRGGLFRVHGDGSFDEVLRDSVFNPIFVPGQARCFYESGYKGKVAEWNLSSNSQVRTAELTPEDDGPTSPRFPPPWYQGDLIARDEYLLADFGSPQATGGVWKWGPELAAPVRLYDTQSSVGSGHVWAITFTTDRVLAMISQPCDDERCGQLCDFDGHKMLPVPNVPVLPAPGSLQFEPHSGDLLISHYLSTQVDRLTISDASDSPTELKPFITGFESLRAGTLRLSEDRNYLVVTDREHVYVFGRVGTPPLDLNANSKSSAFDILTSENAQWAEPENLGAAFNSQSDDSHPNLSSDGLTLVFQSERDGGHGDRDLWFAYRQDKSSSWSTPINAGPHINSLDTEHRPSLALNGRLLAFQRGAGEIWVTSRSSTDAEWPEPAYLTEGVSPVMCESGLSLFYSDKGQIHHLVRASLSADWQTVQTSIPGFSTPAWLSADEQTILIAHKPDSSGGSVLLCVVRRDASTGDWTAPVPLPATINSGRHQYSGTLSEDDETLIFSSTRDGGLGGDDLWFSRRVKRSPHE